MAVFTVLVRGLEIYAYHGVSSSEQEVGHRYRIDVSLVVEGSADETDRIEDTVDYSAVAATIQRVLTECQCKTVERLCGLCAGALLEEFLRVQSVQIEIVKPAPPMPFLAAFAGAALVRHRP